MGLLSYKYRYKLWNMEIDTCVKHSMYQYWLLLVFHYYNYKFDKFDKFNIQFNKRCFKLWMGVFDRTPLWNLTRIFWHHRKVWTSCKACTSNDSGSWSDYLTDLYTGKSKKNFIKNCPQWGLKPEPLHLQANALPTELSQESVGQEISEVNFVSCTTSHVGLCSFLESIEHDFIKAMKILAGNWMLT